MIILDVEQGSEEWLKARCGIPTASNFDKIVTTKGEPSKQAKKYMNQLAGEKITGVPAENFKSAYMERGKEVEEEARNFYNLVADAEIQCVGLVYGDDTKSYSCSPDGLLGVDGGFEVKCPAIFTHVEYLLKGVLPLDYFQQVQGNLFVTGRKWWDFFSYYPGLKPLKIRVYRNEAFIVALKHELDLFCLELNNVTEKIR